MSWAETLARMYAGSQSFSAPVMTRQAPVHTGSSTGPSALDAFGSGLGQGIEKGVSTAAGGYMGAAMDIKKQEMMMDSPETSFKMMKGAHEMYNSMPPELQEKVQSNTEFQRRLHKWSTMFPGSAPIYSDPDTGLMSFAAKNKTIDQQKASALQGMSEQTPGAFVPQAGVGVSSEPEIQTQGSGQQLSREDLLFSEEKSRLASAEKDRVQARLAPETAAATNLYHERAGKAMEANANQRQETEAEKTQRAIQVAEIGIQKQAAVDAAKDKRVSQAQDLKDSLAAETNMRTNFRNRQTALNTGKAADRTAAVLEDANDVLTFMDGTNHILDSETPLAAITASKHKNYALQIIDRLAQMYMKKLGDATTPDNVLSELRSRGEALYERFNYRDPKTGKMLNALRDPRADRAIVQMNQKRTEQTMGGKEMNIPNDMGFFNRQLLKATGRYF